MYYLLGTDEKLNLENIDVSYGIVPCCDDMIHNNLYKKNFYYVTKSDIQFGYNIINIKDFYINNESRNEFNKFIEFIKNQLIYCKEIVIGWQEELPIDKKNINRYESFNIMKSLVEINLTEYEFSENQFEFEWNTKYVFTL